MDRRAFLGRLGIAGAGASLSPLPSHAFSQDSVAAQDTAPAGRLWDPYRAGRAMQPTDPRDSDPGVQALEKRLKCTCGCGLDIYTCRTTDFTCTYSPARHREVLALLDAGRTPDDVVAEFVARYGQEVLMAPPKRGFNLTAYFVPGLAVVAAGIVLVVVLRRWTRAAAVAAAASTAPVPAGAPLDAAPEELARLQRELDEFSA